MTQVQAGNRDAFTVLMRRYRAPLFNFLARMTGSPRDAEEAYQDAFVKVFQYSTRFRAGALFRPWLYRIATNCCRDLLRKQRRHDAVGRIPLTGDEKTPLDEKIADSSQDPRAQAAAREMAERLEAAVAALPVKQRAVFLMARYQGMAYPEIAKALQVPAGTVKSRMNAAVNQLAEILREIEP